MKNTNLSTVLSCLFSSLVLGQCPSATLTNGVVVGTSDLLSNQDRFLGIPFALPPTGDRRLRAPQPISTRFPGGTLTATTSPTGCPQFQAASPSATLPSVVTASIATGTPNVFEFAASQPQAAEDCLYLNVQRPSGTTPSSKLPVLIWIYGGAFQTGSTSLYDNQLMLAKAMTLKTPYIYVAMNYRVSSFGFLAGAQLSKENNTNLGLRDQRMALEWVADNIASFGGDPSKVVIWGESAGAWSTLDQTIINGGNNSYKGAPLFRGAMMNSGAVWPALPVTHPKPQAIFDGLVRDAGCGAAADKLACLRSVDYDTFLAAQNNQTLPNGEIDWTYTARPDPASSFFSSSPEMAIAAGEFARVPVISGNQQDEGAFFAVFLSNINGSDSASLRSLFNPIFPDASNATINGFTDTYPVNVSAGSPYNTGVFNEIFPGYKRLAAIIGDLYFILRRRIYLDSVAPVVPAWSYIATYDHAVPILGSCHITDVLAMYYGIASPDAVDALWTKYISFINFLDPNHIASAYANWPHYDLESRELMSFDAGGVSITTDSFRQSSYLYLKGNDLAFSI